MSRLRAHAYDFGDSILTHKKRLCPSRRITNTHTHTHRQNFKSLNCQREAAFQAVNNSLRERSKVTVKSTWAAHRKRNRRAANLRVVTEKGRKITTGNDTKYAFSDSCQFYESIHHCRPRRKLGHTPTTTATKVLNSFLKRCHGPSKSKRTANKENIEKQRLKTKRKTMPRMGSHLLRRVTRK